MQLWIKGLKVDEKNNVIITWNSNTLSFNNLSGTNQGKCLYQFKDLTVIENHLTDVLILHHFNYFLTGST